MLAWHFLPESRKTRYSNELVTPGSTLRAKGPLQICSNGMHASVSLLDALNYAPGPVICRVRMHGDVLCGGDKVVAEARECLWMYDATEVLQAFTTMQALSVAHLWDMPEHVRAFLMHGGDYVARKSAEAASQGVVQTTVQNATLHAAQAAVTAVTWDTAWSTIRDITWSTVRNATAAAAWDAVGDTILDSVSVAAYKDIWYTTWNPIWDASRRQLEDMILKHKP